MMKISEKKPLNDTGNTETVYANLGNATVPVINALLLLTTLSRSRVLQRTTIILPERTSHNSDMYIYADNKDIVILPRICTNHPQFYFPTRSLFPTTQGLCF